MSSRVRKCGGCGGPLSEAVSVDGTITCSFCGTVNEVTAPAPPRQQVVIKMDGVVRPAMRAGAAVAVVVGVVVIFIVIAASVIVYQTVMRPASSGLNAVSTQALRARELSRPLLLTELPTYKERGQRPVNAPPPPGGWKGFDAVAALPWVNEIALAWAPDARLTRIDLGLIASDGAADLTGDRQDTVGYRFISPSRIAQWSKIADRDVDAAAAYELLVRIGRSEVMVYVHSGRPPSDPPPPALDSLPLRELLTQARQNTRFPTHPFYTGFLIYNDRSGWIWYLQSLSRREMIPQVRARDAAVYPWR